MKEVTLNIDGIDVKTEEGTPILEAAKKIGIKIPTLCYHEDLSSYGACRLCSVEISKNGRSKVVASCAYPSEEGLTVKTDTERIIKIRKMILELLLARCPQVKVLQDLAKDYGLEETRFEVEDQARRCILCGLCERACEEVVGRSVLGSVGRGVDRQVGTPFLEEPGPCIGCGACAFVCPTGAIEMEDVGDTRIIRRWNRQAEFKLKKCSVCRNYFAPEIQLEYIRRRANLPADFFEVCPDCKK